MALPSSRYDQDNCFDENDLDLDSNETYLDLINDSIVKNSKITTQCLKKLLNRKDCFVIAKKDKWKSYAEFNEDFEKVINKTNTVDYMSIPQNASDEDRLEIHQWVKFQTNTVDGEQYSIIGGLRYD